MKTRISNLYSVNRSQTKGGIMIQDEKVSESHQQMKGGRYGLSECER
jgi:hypothetical protein